MVNSIACSSLDSEITSVYVNGHTGMKLLDKSSSFFDPWIMLKKGEGCPAIPGNLKIAFGNSGPARICVISEDSPHFPKLEPLAFIYKRHGKL